MPDRFLAWLVPLAAYLCGSILPAEVLARRRGVDLRRIRRNPGTMEIYRQFGLRPALLVYALDAAKGVLPLLLGSLLRVDAWSLALAGVASVAGHNWSIFYRFWGGRGLATASGALLYLLPVPFFLGLAPSLYAWWRTRFTPASGIIGLPLISGIAWVLEPDPYRRAVPIALALILFLQTLVVLGGPATWFRKARGP